MSLDSREFRNAVGRFATGVCVITTFSPEQVPMGMTVNSFTSVSLDPPLVLWSLQNSSDCYPVFSPAEHWTINILAQDQLPLSNQYSRKNEHELSPEHFRIGVTGAPVLRGALASFECRIWQRYDGGDHQLLVGEVKSMSTRPTGRPLLFYGGRYQELR